MDVQEELQQIKREHALALQVAEERRSQLSQAILAQRNGIVAQWSPIVTALLDETARATWGDDAYSIVEPDPKSFTYLTWTAVREQGTAKLNYQVSIRCTVTSIDDPTLSPDTPLVVPVGFQISGAQDFLAILSEQALKEALISVFKVGPKDGGLDKYTEVVLSETPYKEGEYGKADWKIIVGNAFTLLTGLILLFTGEAVIVLTGLLLVVLSALAFSITRAGKRFTRLEPGQKAIVILALIYPGLLLALA